MLKVASSIVRGKEITPALFKDAAELDKRKHPDAPAQQFLPSKKYSLEIIFTSTF